MKKCKVLIGLLVAILMVASFVLSGCGGSGANKSAADSQKKAKLRLGWVVAYQEDHPYTVAAETFAKIVKAKTNGRIEFDLFPGGQLGGDRDMFEAIQLGTLDAGVISAPVVSAFTKVLVGTDMPYIFNNDYDLMYKAEAGEPGKKLLKRLEQETKVKALAFTYQPFRHFHTTKEIKSLADMKGLKIRAMQSPIHIDIFKALGANPTPIPYTEVYTSMQTGTIDGFESDVIGSYASKFYDVTKHITISGHFNNAIILVMSPKTWDKLSPEDQKIMQEAADEAAKASLDITKTADAKYMQIMKDKGVQVNTVDLKEFVEAEKGVIAKYSQEIPEVKEFVEAVQAMQKK
jgi:tripartite ATP-independent periplasmic transporter solute receptor, DctP family